MEPHLSALFRRLFPLLVAGFVLAVLGLSAAVWVQGAGLLRALGLALGGLVLLVAAFGLVAVQIENNALLHRIASALEDGGTDRREAPGGTDGTGSAGARAAAPVIPLATRSEPPLRRAPRPAGRVEPPLSRRG